MKIDLNKIQNSKCFHLIWCLLGICILWQLGTTMARSALLPKRVQKALEQYKESTEQNTQMQASKTEPKEQPKSMFAPPKKVQMPTCSAVLGDEALINDKWYKVGSTAGDAKIVAINPESVKILWEEKEHILVPFDVKVESAGQGGNGQSPSANKESSATPRPNGRNMRNTENATTGISSDETRQMRERYQNVSPDEQKQMRRQMQERYQNASPEEQEQMRQQIRQSQGRG